MTNKSSSIRHQRYCITITLLLSYLLVFSFTPVTSTTQNNTPHQHHHHDHHSLPNNAIRKQSNLSIHSNRKSNDFQSILQTRTRGGGGVGDYINRRIISFPKMFSKKTTKPVVTTTTSNLQSISLFSFGFLYLITMNRMLHRAYHHYYYHHNQSSSSISSFPPSAFFFFLTQITSLILYWIVFRYNPNVYKLLYPGAMEWIRLLPMVTVVPLLMNCIAAKKWVLFRGQDIRNIISMLGMDMLAFRDVKMVLKSIGRVLIWVAIIRFIGWISKRYQSAFLPPNDDNDNDHLVLLRPDNRILSTLIVVTTLSVFMAFHHRYSSSRLSLPIKLSLLFLSLLGYEMDCGRMIPPWLNRLIIPRSRSQDPPPPDPSSLRHSFRLPPIIQSTMTSCLGVWIITVLSSSFNTNNNDNDDNTNFWTVVRSYYDIQFFQRQQPQLPQPQPQPQPSLPNNDIMENILWYFIGPTITSHFILLYDTLFHIRRFLHDEELKRQEEERRKQQELKKQQLMKPFQAVIPMRLYHYGTDIINYFTDIITHPTEHHHHHHRHDDDKDDDKDDEKDDKKDDTVVTNEEVEEEEMELVPSSPTSSSAVVPTPKRGRFDLPIKINLELALVPKSKETSSSRTRRRRTKTTVEDATNVPQSTNQETEVVAAREAQEEWMLTRIMMMFSSFLKKDLEKPSFRDDPTAAMPRTKKTATPVSPSTRRSRMGDIVDDSSNWKLTRVMLYPTVWGMDKLEEWRRQPQEKKETKETKEETRTWNFWGDTK